MLAYATRKLLISIPVLFFATLVAFLLVATVDPIAEQRVFLLSQPGGAEQVARLEASLGLDKPLIERYGTWLGDLVQGDMGSSTENGRAVTTLLGEAIPVTLRLVVAATVISVVFGVTVGVISAVRKYSVFDNVSTFFAFLFFAMPVFWLGAVLKDLGIRFNDWWGRRIFFTIGEQSPRLDADFWGTWADRAGHIILPALTLILIQLAATSRFQRSAMLDVLESDYVRTARAKGVPRHRVVTRHALRNALLPVVSYTGLTFGTLIGGTVVTEEVFNWQGMGRLFLDSLLDGDVAVSQGWLLAVGVSVIAVNLLTDLVYGLLDPRVRHG
ncbi:MAG: ABC transporter permease [Acidimicrobiaceae bacterium]|nr:ABC transporter permease [Acidimicrobiaceae bacterium]MXW76146.1 ABC transporter permease [Acidimicrobiaceae bacterium]MYC42291.1 ABC transporter permease [Acidimicrobiaceae bacterium]MYD07273.1 ABC transporter permease [Acidimicrobiaceae bacterium]MYH87365.1 ABC transporter permease [Acidimicrobiaceae bacterium]